MNDNTNSLFTGQDVWWSDPENKTSGAYIVLETIPVESFVRGLRAHRYSGVIKQTTDIQI